MNTSGDSTGFLGSNNFSGFSYGVGVSVGILILITTITLASYFCSRTNPDQNPGPDATSAAARRAGSDNHLALDVGGLDEEVIRSYPKLLYSEVIKGKYSGRDTCCAVCLADYKGSDRLRMLPDCSHLFHRRCIDPWLRMNPTCPVCRTSPLPTPLSTPLAEVVPLAGRRDQGRSHEFEY